MAPIPKRSHEVMGHRTRAEMAQRTDGQAFGAADVPVPDPDPTWHPVALQWYRGLAESGQAQFYEPSDWATAQYVAEMMHRHLSQAHLSAATMTAILSATTELMCTEGSRRRLRLELQRPGAAQPGTTEGVTTISDYRRRLSG